MDIQTVYSAMLARDLSAQTVRHTHAVLHNALDQAVAWRLITTNPSARPSVVLPKTKREEMQVLDSDQAASFLKVANDMAHGLLFEFALLKA